MMKRHTLSLFGAVLAGLFLGNGTARAELVHWTYNWGRAPVALAADGAGTGGVTLTDESSHEATGSSDVVATNIRTFSSAPSKTPDTFTNKAYTLSLNLTDDASKKTTTLNFAGALSGTVSANSANLKNQFTGMTSQTVKLGDNTYVVMIGPYAPPGPPTASNAGTISAHILVNERPDAPPPPPDNGGGNPPPVHETPEPSSMLLAALGLLGLGGYSWSKRRGYAEPAAVL